MKSKSTATASSSPSALPGERAQLRELSDVLGPLRPYLAHRGWRCTDRNWHSAAEWEERGDCYCGLVAALQSAGSARPEALHIAWGAGF